MLKIVKTTLAIAIASSAVAMPAHAGVEDALANICTIVEANDKGELRKKLRKVQNDFNLKLHNYYSGVSCNGESLIRTAIKNDSVDVGTLLVKKMRKADLANAEADGQTLQAWIQANGFDASPIAQEVAGRI